MALRLFLVSVVAGLGLSLPTGARVANWKDQAQAWVSARLADWDAPMPADESAFVYITDAAPTPPEHAPAPPPAPVPAPAAIPATAVTIVAAPAPAACTPDAPLVAPTEPTPMDDAGMDLPLALAEAEVPATAAPSDPEPVVDAPFDAAQDAVLSAFASDRPSVMPPTFEPMDVGDDLYPGVAFALNRANEGLERIAAPAPRFEPMEVGDDLYPGFAFALNHASEGLDLPAPPPAATPRPAAAAPTNLSRAVQLTREAVYAWANLLHGPAVVTIGR